MPDETTALDEQLLRSVCHEAQQLAGKVSGGVRRLSVRAGEYGVDIEWDPGAAPAAAPVAAPTSTAAPAAGEADGDRHAIKAPLVGTFYRSPEPGAKPFVSEGDVIEVNQVVGIVEAMKIMNRIESDCAGRVASILVGDGEMVEFGQDLVVVEPS